MTPTIYITLKSLLQITVPQIHTPTHTQYTHTQTDRHKEREDEKSEKETWLNYFK